MAETEKNKKPSPDRARDIVRRLFRHENAILAIVLVVMIAIVAVVTGGKSTQLTNVVNVIRQSSMRGIAAIGQAFVILTAGIDVSIGGLVLLTSVLGASLMTAAATQRLLSSPISLAAGIAVMILTGIGWGTVSGLSVSRIKMPPLIVTLAIWQIAKGIAFRLCIGRSIGQLPSGIAFFGQGEVVNVPVPSIIFVSVAAIAYFVLTYTTYGKSVYATGGNPVSAWLSGINVDNILLSVYAVSGLLAAMVGVIYTGLAESSSMMTGGGVMLDSIAAATVGGVSLAGGKGNIIGVVLGTLIIGVINNVFSLLGALPALQGIAKGSIIIGAVALDYVLYRR
jgi:ribose/xylose/arabinose/galactoside ABC-type transport system permease subunit